MKRENKKGRFYQVYVIEKSLRHHVIEWVATILSALGAIFNSNIFNITSFDTYASSFYFWFIADILWISFALKHKHWGVFTTFLIFGIINIIAIIKHLNIF